MQTSSSFKLDQCIPLERTSGETRQAEEYEEEVDDEDKQDEAEQQDEEEQLKMILKYLCIYFLFL